jgi:hypothetical protein
VVEYRYADNEIDRLPALVADLMITYTIFRTFRIDGFF